MLKKFGPREMLSDLLDDILAGKVNIDMTTFGTSCGTPACIAGNIVARHGDFQSARYNNIFEEQAKALLQLSSQEAHLMFYGNHLSSTFLLAETVGLENLATRVPAMLRHYLNTGEIDWDQEPLKSDPQ